MFYDVGKKLSCLRLLKKFTEQTTLFLFSLRFGWEYE